MRKWAIVFLLVKIALPVFAAKPAMMQQVTVDQLEQALAAAHNRKDHLLAKQISNMKLTERLSCSRLDRLEEMVQGPHAKEALTAIADESAFLNLPASELPAKPTPSAAEQTAMLNLSANYVAKEIASWPSFIATRETARFEGTATVIPGDLQDRLFALDSVRAPTAANWECPGQPKLGYQRLSLIDHSNVAVVNRNGRELHALAEKGGEFECPENAVSTIEEFGKVLEWVPKIVAHGDVDWSHWEQGPSGLLAVFRYAVVLSRHSVQIDIQGEIALDPKDGSILRLTETRRWRKHESAPETNIATNTPANAAASAGTSAGYDATVEYNTAVEYGPVNLGGAVYLCPIRRIAIYLTPILWPPGMNQVHDELYRRFNLPESPLQEYLNDVHFTQYRLYGPS
ncbi:MAG TPA: hypothetical protein VFB43_08155 [Terracidiphilus sp.]|nr:hypothetical protein [Terracidiphilus sp.]